MCQSLSLRQNWRPIVYSQGSFFTTACSFIEKETPEQVIS